MVLPSVSFSDLIGELAGTYQKRSDAPVVSALMMRSGAPFEYKERAPMMPPATPRSTLPETTACCVSPAPCVHRISSTRPCFLKMPARWPTSEIDVSQLPRWPAAILSVSWANAASCASANRKGRQRGAKSHDPAHRILQTRASPACRGRQSTRSTDTGSGLRWRSVRWGRGRVNPGDVRSIRP